MTTLLGFFANRWVLPVAGLGVISLLIWYIGGEITIFGYAPLASGAVRGIAIVLVFFVWTLIELRRAVVANRANRGIVDGMAETKDPKRKRDSAADEQAVRERSEIKQRFDQAAAILRKPTGKYRRLNLYHLPWYIVIGPPGCGKTTALECSGLRFPLANKLGQKLKGVGGTRNCDFWFTDEAVLLDTAGRFTTQDSEEETDRSAWQTFLGELKSKRPRRPINGVIVAISVHDLITLDADGREDQAHKVKSRIDELYTRFGMRFPVYVMFTKCDLLAGFTEFFGDMDAERRAQVWGTTFAMDDSDSDVGAVSQFSAEFQRLVRRLNERVLSRLEAENDGWRRASIYGFPAQFAGLEKTVQAFLSHIFEGSAYERPPMLRGVYFSSGTQEGTPIDRLLGTVMRNFGLDAEALHAHTGAGKSYFIRSLLQHVVFGESEIAGTNRRLEARQAWLQRAAYAGCAVAVALAVFLWALSYVNNRAYVADVRESTATARLEIADVPAGNRDPSLVVSALDAVRRIPGGYDDRDAGTPWLSGFGLSQRRTLGAQAARTYLEVSRQLLLPRLMLRLEGQLRTGGSVSDYQYEGLKTYLMLDSKSHYAPAEVVRWFEADVNSSSSLRLNEAERGRMVGHVRALFEEQPLPLPQSLDAALIDETRLAVSRLPLESRILGRLRRSEAAVALPEFSLFEAAGPMAQAVFRRSGSADLSEDIDGLFTRDGYRRVLITQVPLTAGALIDEAWVLGPYAPTELASANVMARVRELYLDEFSDQYQSLLLGLELAPFASPDEAADILNILSHPTDSPLLRLFQAVAEETRLGAETTEDEDLEEQATAAAQTAFENLIGVGDRPRPNAGRSRNTLEERFEWVAELVAGEPSSAPIQHVLSLLEELYRFMVQMSNETGARGDIPANVAERGRSVVQQLEVEAGRQPPMLAGLLTTAASRSQSLAFSGVSAHVNNEWRSGPLPFCRNAIMGRYPIATDTTRDISLNDFGAFFGPGGELDSFFDEYLADYVNRSASPWRMRGAAGTPINISANALRQFERAALIRDTFFQGGGRMPAVLFELQPLYMDPEIRLFTLALGGDPGGRRITYSFGPDLVEYVEWPGSQPNAEVRVEVTPPTTNGVSMMREVGPWAWFRVLDRAVMRPGPMADKFEIEFDLDGRPILYELTIRGAYNPFRMVELEQFSCPESL